MMALSVNMAASMLSRITLRSTTISIRSPAAALSLSNMLRPSVTIPAISIPLPALWADIWEGVLKAVPKKKTSHSKRRSRQLAGKALKDTKSLNSCPGCGKPKRAHLLCPYCVAEIQQGWREAEFGSKAEKAITNP